MKEVLPSALSCKHYFPLLNDSSVVYLDSAATSQKPMCVINAMTAFYQASNANIHRGVYKLSAAATQAYENARQSVAEFISASPCEIIFVRNATEGINLVAKSFAGSNLKRGDLVLITEMEHHSNIVPWQQVCKERGAMLKYIPIQSDGTLNLEELDLLLQQRPRIVAVTHVSNVLGTINPIADIARKAHAAGAVVLVDACQSVPHLPLDVTSLGADFLVFSGHKMLGPTGIGVLWAKRKLLEAMPPFITGGDMIREVHWQESSWADIPQKFEAGTPAIAEAIGLGVAVKYLEELGMKNIQTHDFAIMKYAMTAIESVSGITTYGPTDPHLRVGVISFNLEGAHPHDVASVLDDFDVCIRSGHHCAMPLHEKLGVPATCRISFGPYTTVEDIDRFITALQEAKRVLKV